MPRTADKPPFLGYGIFGDTFTRREGMGQVQLISFRLLSAFEEASRPLPSSVPLTGG